MEGRRSVGAATIAEAFRLTVEDNADRIAVRTQGRRDRLDVGGAAASASTPSRAACSRLGLTRGDTLALMISNRPEFMVADLAATMLGATPFCIYLTSSPDQVAYVIAGRGRADRGRRGAVRAARGAARRARDHRRGDRRRTSSPGFEPDWRAVEPDDILTLIYTSGTTGPPKGVQLAHRNEMAAVDAVEQRVGFPDGSRVISWLPSAHVAERTAHHYLPIVYAMTITTCPDPRRIGEFLPAVNPTWFFAVPRVWEKLKAGVEAKLAGDEGAQKLLAAGTQRVELEQAGRADPGRAAAGPGARRGEAVQAAAGGDRPRRGQAGQRRRRAHAARGARLLPRDRRPAGGDLGHVGDLRRGRLQPGGADQDRHGRAAVAGRRAQARRGRRAARALAGRDARLPQPAAGERSTTTAGSPPATSRRSTRTATSRSSTARRS